MGVGAGEATLKIITDFLKHREIDLPHDSALSLLGIGHTKYPANVMLIYV